MCTSLKDVKNEFGKYPQRTQFHLLFQENVIISKGKINPGHIVSLLGFMSDWGFIDLRLLLYSWQLSQSIDWY